MKPGTRSRSWILAGAALALILFYGRAPEKQANAPAVNPLSNPDPVAKRVSAVPGPPSLPSASPRPTPGDSIPLVAPDREEVRREVNAEPHSPPPSLLRFAETLSIQMEKALHDEKAASRLWSELTDCALSGVDRTPAASRALCAVNLSRLSERYPGRFDLGILESLDEPTRLIVLAMKQI